MRSTWSCQFNWSLIISLMSLASVTLWILIKSITIGFSGQNVIYGHFLGFVSSCLHIVLLCPVRCLISNYLYFTVTTHPVRYLPQCVNCPYIWYPDLQFWDYLYKRGMWLCPTVYPELLRDSCFEMTMFWCFYSNFNYSLFSLTWESGDPF